MPTAPSSKICRHRAMLPEASAAVPARVGLSQLLATFVRLGTMTFGGGVQSWIHREVVQRLGWINDKSFLSGMTVAQILPGANPVNMALYVGLHLRGGVGAAVAVFGMLIPAFCTTLLLGALYRSYGHLAAVHFVLAGMAAAGVGATLTMGIKVARRLPRNLVTALIAVTVFVLVGVLRWPMIPVVVVMVPLSIALAFVAERKSEAVS
jgi:chromate transporter